MDPFYLEEMAYEFDAYYDSRAEAGAATIADMEAFNRDEDAALAEEAKAERARFPVAEVTPIVILPPDPLPDDGLPF